MLLFESRGNICDLDVPDSMILELVEGVGVLRGCFEGFGEVAALVHGRRILHFDCMCRARF